MNQIFIQIIATILAGVFMVLCYLVVIVTHEFFHWTALKFFGFKNVSFKLQLFFGEAEVGRNTHKKLNLKQTFVVSLAGVLGGFIPLYVLKFILSQTNMLILGGAYLLGSSIDFITMNMILGEKDKSMTLYDLNVKEFNKYKKEVAKYDKKGGKD